MNIDSELLDMRLVDLSGGQKSKIAFAHLLYSSPEVMLLDEPTNGLDDEGVEIVRRLILEEKERGALILLASHNSSDISLLTDIVYRINNGTLREVKGKGEIR